VSSLSDLYAHQAWADARQWRAFEAHPSALEDRKLVERLHHIHLVQHLFLAVVRSEAPVPTKPADFPTPAALKDYGRRHHEEAASFVPGLDPQRLQEPVSIPWFESPPLQITVEDALTQAAMHSHYHRGQNATRLRELGGEPPLTDLIIWYWKGRPAARWE
jgi:uncharacterized damage-inducible protein DinB